VGIWSHHRGQKRSLHPNESEEAMMSEASQFLKMYFESFAEHSRHCGTPEPASCFDAVARTIEDVSPELLDAYVKTFQKIDDGELDYALKLSIQQGAWSPASATEYMQRFIAFTSGTEPAPSPPKGALN
jgi:hypothetical protein